jgi:hypothetical protein
MNRINVITVIIRLMKIRPNAVAVWLTLLLHIQEVPGSNLGPETAYLN